MKRVILILLLASLGTLCLQSSWAQTIYKCETDQGVTFSPQPCSADAQKVRPRDGSGGVDVLDADRVTGSSEAPAHDGPVQKTLGGQVRANKQLLDRLSLHKKSPQKQPCSIPLELRGKTWPYL